MRKSWMQDFVRWSLRSLGRLHPDLGAKASIQIFTRPRRYRRPKAEKELIGRGRAHRYRNGLSAHIFGEGPNKILLLHGWEGRGSQLRAFVEPLLLKKFEVIVLDGHAHGDSPGKNTNAVLFTQQLLECAQEIGSLHAIVAHSFGAGCTLMATAWGLAVKRIVLVASPSSFEDVLNNFTRFVGLDEPSANAFLRGMEKQTGMKVSELNLQSMAAKITQPVLIVHDREDKDVAYRHAEQLLNSLPKAQLLTTEGQGHRRILKSPKVIDTVVQFLEGSK